MRWLRLFLHWAAAAWLAGAGAAAQGQAPPASAAAPPDVPDLVESAFRWGDFDELERLYAIHGKAGVRSERSGIPRVEQFWKGIARINNSGLRVTDEYYQQLDALTQHWAQGHPRSVLAQLLHADTLRNHAWVHRGNGFADTVSPAAWVDFRKYLDLALAQLRRSEALAARDASWNVILLGVGRGLGWDKESLSKVFEAGIAKNPESEGLYFEMLTALLPKWGGDLESVDRFIALAVKGTRDRLGLEMYARLYASLSYDEVNQSLFKSTRASWPSMKAGFEDRLRRYPHVGHRNMYAYFACMAEDRAALQEQLELIGDQFDPGFWGSNAARRFEACKKLARQT